LDIPDGALIRESGVSEEYYYSKKRGRVEASNAYFYKNLRSLVAVAQSHWTSIEDAPLRDATCGLIACYFATQLIGVPVAFEELRRRVPDAESSDQGMSLRTVSSLLSDAGIHVTSLRTNASSLFSFAPYAILPVSWETNPSAHRHYVVATKTGEAIRLISPCEQPRVVTPTQLSGIWDGYAVVFPVDPAQEETTESWVPSALFIAGGLLSAMAIIRALSVMGRRVPRKAG